MLFDLPSDALHEVCSRLTTPMIARLWFCGSKSLHRKMADRSGVRKLHVSWLNAKAIPSWPMLVSSFPYLRELTFSASFRSFPAQFSVADILSLPPNLKKLAMSFNNDLQLFHAAFLASPDRFSDLHVLSVRGEISSSSSSLELPLRWPPNLTELRLGRMNGLPLRIASLPPHLTHISAHTTRFVWNEGDPAFPSTLTAMEAAADTTLPNLFELLPRALLRLSTSSSPDFSLNWDAIPPCLTYLSHDVTSFARENWAKLPRTLQTIYFSLEHAWRITESLMHELPASLMHASAVFPMIITPSLAKLLPRQMVELEEEVQWHSIPYLPPSLKSLSIYNDVGSERLTEGDKCEAAAAANEVLLQHNCELGATFLPEVEQELMMSDVFIVMRQRIGASELRVRVPNMKRLFPNMTALSLYANPELIFSPLPVKLVSFRFDCSKLTPLICKKLPPTLTTLSCLEGLSGEDCFPLLPRKLTRLGMYTYAHREKNLVTIHNPESSAWLPRGIRNFSLGPFAMPPLDWFQQLPPTIFTLEIHISTGMHTLDRPISLPPALRSLSMCFAGPDVQNMRFIFASLPKTLAYLSIFSPDTDLGITDNDLMCLPPLLHTAQLPKSKGVTGTCKDHLPAGIASLEIGGEIPAWYTNAESRGGTASTPITQ